MDKVLYYIRIKDKVRHVSVRLPTKGLTLTFRLKLFMETCTMAKKKELKATIMGEDAIYVTFITVISVGLLFLGASLSFHG